MDYMKKRLYLMYMQIYFLWDMYVFCSNYALCILKMTLQLLVTRALMC